ncbi:MAG TPA: hypothetical protein VL068_06780 [Microthrixaceae bacterium]|nr:hypothetical protein [Microthrixaceae bacterium]
MFVTAGTAEHAELVGEVLEALDDLGLDVRIDGDAVLVDGNRAVLLLVSRAHPTPADLRSLITDSRGRGPVVIVADRISEAGRNVLRSEGWGWLDRRGHLRIWAPGVRIEGPLPTVGTGRPVSSNLWTPLGLEVALHSLLNPTEVVSARRVAPAIGRSVGATHELIARFTAAGLVGRRTRLPLLPELFWETAANWPDDDWTPLPLPIDAVAERVGPEELVRVDERAATLGGARVAAAGELPARCYVKSPAALRRLRALMDRDAPTQCWVREPPVEWVPLNSEHPPDDAHPWAVAAPMLCALRLAADPARGSEIIEDWGIVPTGES